MTLEVALAGVSPGGPTSTTVGRSTIALGRVVDGIPVADSQANAELNDRDQSVRETIFWPEIDASVIAEAKRFRAELADPAKLAAYKAKLPEAARGDGRVSIHHSIGMNGQDFRAGVSWDTQQGRSPVSFDANGTLVPTRTF